MELTDQAFIARYRTLKMAGKTEVAIAAKLGMPVSTMRERKAKVVQNQNASQK